LRENLEEYYAGAALRLRICLQILNERLWIIKYLILYTKEQQGSRTSLYR
jgi:hypothetical protein